MPQQSFRQPSVSSIDRTQSDPTASENTPKLRFKWKKDGKLSKDYACSLSGKSTNLDGSRRKNKEPDITLSIFKHLKEITMYEPNLSRVEMEDPKGLEVVMLLSAIVIREVCNGQIRETFNVTDAPRRLSGERPPRKNSSDRTNRQRNDLPPLQTLPSLQSQKPLNQNPTFNIRPPPTDPRSQWEIDAETARLQKQVEREERERRRREHAETKRVKKMLEEEEQRARQKQSEIDKETERLKREYEKEQRQAQKNTKPPLPVRLNASLQPPFAGMNYPPPPLQRPHSASPYHNAGPYVQPVGNAASSSVFFQGPSSSVRPADGRRVGARPSFFNRLAHPDHGGQRLSKKQSAVF